MSGLRVRDVMEALQSVSSRPLVLRQVPIREEGKNGDVVAGYVDLVSERAYRYHPGQPSDLVKLPDDMMPREQEAREQMLEHLADFDDQLLEQLLSDAVPSKEAIYQQLQQGPGAGPDRAGADGRRGAGLRRAPPAEGAAPRRAGTGGRRAHRLGLDGEATAVVVFKTYHQPHSGKVALARVLSRPDRRRPDPVRPAHRRAAAAEGQRLRQDREGRGGRRGRPWPHGRAQDRRCPDRERQGAGGFKWPEPLAPLYALAVDAENRNDEVKLTAALAKLSEEDPSLRYGHNPDTHELLLHGQGDIHLQIALERLKLRYNLPVKARRPQVSYKETIRAQVKQHARFKRQSGGHGQFGDVHVEVWPQARGQGFEFHDRVVGGSVPRQFIGSVEEGVREYLARGPLGFPVVDVAVALYDGQYHSVDSSDAAFKTAARMAMQEAMPKCQPILLEPIFAVDISAPASLISRVHSLVTGRRGQILQIAQQAGLGRAGKWSNA